MIKKLKIVAIAILLAGATVTASKATTLYESLSVNLVLSYYQAKDTVSTDGTITYPVANRKITTAEFMELMATNLHISLSKSATLMRVTTLVEGTNLTDFSTNVMTAAPVSVATIAGDTVLTNIQVPMTIVWQDVSTGTIFYTNNYLLSNSPPSGAPPNNHCTAYSVTNFTNFVIQAKVNKVIVESNVEYCIINGTPITDTSLWVPLNVTNTEGPVGVSITTLDDARNFRNRNVGGPPYYIDDTNTFSLGSTTITNYFGDSYNAPANVSMNMAELVTNLSANAGVAPGYGPIFVGSIKTNMAMAGTLTGDTIQIRLGDPDETAGTTNFLANLILTNMPFTTVATATTAIVTNKLPFTSWNATFDVAGYGTLDGFDTNNLFSTNYVYMDANFASGNVPEFTNEVAGFTDPVTENPTSVTNPPMTFTNNFTYETSSNAPQQLQYPTSYPGATYTTPEEIIVTTPDFTGYSYSFSNFIYTNITTNVYTLVPADTYDGTNFFVAAPITTTFSITGTIKQATVKIGAP